MPLIRTLAALVSLLLCWASPAAAIADDWTLTKASGEVAVAGALIQSIAVKTGMTIRPGQTLTTGKTGRAFLVHNNDTVSVGPNTVLSVPFWPATGLTTLVQRSGTIELEVEKLGQPHLSVETPFLAAVVKGTHFTVAVTGTGSRVSVARGLVQVSDLRSGETAAVGAGQAAEVRVDAAHLLVSGGGSLPKVQPGAQQRAPSAPATTAASASIAGDGSGGSSSGSGGSGSSGSGSSGSSGGDDQGGAGSGNSGPGGGNSGGNGNSGRGGDGDEDDDDHGGGSGGGKGKG